MSSDQPCYTLINIPGDTDPPNEVQIKQDLGLINLKPISTYLSIDIRLFYIYFTIP